MMHMQALIIAIESYKQEIGEVPSSENRLTAQLLSGTNAKSVVFFTKPSMHLNDKGEIVDAWSFPYQFEITREKTSVTSPGLKETLHN